MTCASPTLAPVLTCCWLHQTSFCLISKAWSSIWNQLLVILKQTTWLYENILAIRLWKLQPIKRNYMWKASRVTGKWCEACKLHAGLLTSIRSISDSGKTRTRRRIRCFRSLTLAYFLSHMWNGRSLKQEHGLWKMYSVYSRSLNITMDQTQRKLKYLVSWVTANGEKKTTQDECDLFFFTTSTAKILPKPDFSSLVRCTVWNGKLRTNLLFALKHWTSSQVNPVKTNTSVNTADSKELIRPR